MRRFLWYGVVCGLGPVSCSRYALMNKVQVEFKGPVKTAHVECDTAFCLRAPEVFALVRLQIVSDSILVIKK